MLNDEIPCINEEIEIKVNEAVQKAFLRLLQIEKEFDRGSLVRPVEYNAQTMIEVERNRPNMCSFTTGMLHCLVTRWNENQVIEQVAQEIETKFEEEVKYKIIYDCNKMYEEMVTDIEEFYG